jgi:hypothetical protein
MVDVTSAQPHDSAAYEVHRAAATANHALQQALTWQQPVTEVDDENGFWLPALNLDQERWLNHNTLPITVPFELAL